MLFAHNMSSSSTQPSPPSSQILSKNMELHICGESTRDQQLQPQKSGHLLDSERPLAIIFSWMMAQKKHIMKFGNLYMQQGCDVLTVSLSPTQVLWPVTGSQVVAEDVLKFLVQGDQQQRSLLFHGFSVGAYLYGEMLTKMRHHPNKYGAVADRIVGQIFDSAVDYDGIQHGLPKAVTSNVVIQKLLSTYIKYHMKWMYQTATQHFLTASDLFHNNDLVKAPALFLYSSDDPVGRAEGNLRVIRNWEGRGTKVYVKCFDSSPHVSHLHYHAEEYMEELSVFLERIGLLIAPFREVAQRRASKL